MRFVHFNPGTAGPIQPLDSHWGSSTGTFIKAILSCHIEPACTYVYVNSSEGNTSLKSAFWFLASPVVWGWGVNQKGTKRPKKSAFINPQLPHRAYLYLYVNRWEGKTFARCIKKKYQNDGDYSWSARSLSSLWGLRSQHQLFFLHAQRAMVNTSQHRQHLRWCTLFKSVCFLT